MAAVCGHGGSKRSAQATGAPLGAAEEVVGPGCFDGTLIELLLRDQKVVAQQGQGTVVLRRWLLPGSGSSRNRLGDVLPVSGSGP